MLKVKHSYLLLSLAFLFLAGSCSNQDHKIVDTSNLYAWKYKNYWGFLNARGQVAVLPIYDEVSPFQEGFACVVKNGRYAFIDTMGLLRTQFYSDAGSFNNGWAAVRANATWSFLNKDSIDILVLGQYYNYEVPSFSEGFCAVMNADEKWGYLNTAAEIKIEYQFENAGNFKEGMARVMLNGKWGFIDTKGNIKIKYKTNIPKNKIVIRKTNFFICQY